MNDEPTTDELPTGTCGRVRLLLSLAVDDAATPSQRAEIDAHLPSCGACRRAAAADVAVRRRIAERVDAPAPAWLEGFAGRTARAALAQAREARSQNRLLWMSAAAAVLVAVAAQVVGPAERPGASPESASVRDSTTAALLLRHSSEGK